MSWVLDLPSLRCPGDVASCTDVSGTQEGRGNE